MIIRFRWLMIHLMVDCQCLKLDASPDQSPVQNWPSPVRRLVQTQCSVTELTEGWGSYLNFSIYFSQSVSDSPTLVDSSDISDHSVWKYRWTQMTEQTRLGSAVVGQYHCVWLSVTGLSQWSSCLDQSINWITVSDSVSVCLSISQGWLVLVLRLQYSPH